LFSAFYQGDQGRATIKAKPAAAWRNEQNAASPLCSHVDAAHLLFNDAPLTLLRKIEQVVRLIRFKGIGIYFITKNPLDVPDTVLGQLGNHLQHTLRAFTR
jgi:DNA helicase HerA-like ATPase